MAHNRNEHNAGTPAAPQGIDDMFAALQKEVARDNTGPARVKSWPTPVRIAVGVAVGLLVPLALFSFSRRPDLDTYPSGRFVLESVAYVGAFVGVTLLALGAMTRPLNPRKSLAVALFVVGLIMVCASWPSGVSFVSLRFLESGSPQRRRPGVVDGRTQGGFALLSVRQRHVLVGSGGFGFAGPAWRFLGRRSHRVGDGGICRRDSRVVLALPAVRD